MNSLTIENCLLVKDTFSKLAYTGVSKPIFRLFLIFYDNLFTLRLIFDGLMTKYQPEYAYLTSHL